MPFRPPSIAITAESELPRVHRRGRRFWLAVVLGLLAIVAAATALTVSLASQQTPDVVPYPTVTGSLGDHLQELQKSVEP